MSRNEQRAALATALAIPGAIVTALVFGGPVPLALLAVAVLTGWRFVPHFWRTVGAGAVAGAMAGALILGPGFRLAMRAVAIIEPTRIPEFTFEGTMFIVVFVGVVLGGVLGVASALMRRGLPLSRQAASLLVAAILIGFLLIDIELRSELVELGLGAWMNIPMFGGVGYLYGVVTNRIIDRMESKFIVAHGSGPAAIRSLGPTPRREML